ncbi:GDP-L-fucose synthase family protein [Brevibacillus centrosporus]|uniref:GDP-L-fucose synthase n=1 Tax=Brevibacillus centrosporus TaxID=54910 RepID=A0A1I3VQW3_9BACL|nr:GDP-L-fucose synthase [Brevibacillus centrosporus]MEC2130734.1 GDP-L-fucose synthase [Brevibacillus centrosporus]MED4908174.1 GDP-L-fucose synthase [Brevibacillus centrosporus]RNB69233.1 GDP-L-fucose synthase [Brevibacillus centrosporus]SFJ97778.1 GDP-L-fucose synthase [Brevibacillus centrosporus]GED32166.1 GDP-L-fucose synthase [Brevibacillus centrosporus]
MDLQARIFVAGHRGLVGSAIKRTLEAQGFERILVRDRGELDLLNQEAVARFFAQEQPEYVFMAAAKVGGILANSQYPADFLYQNLVIQTNVIHAAHLFGVKKLLFLGSSCIYPKFAPQPIREQYLLSGELEPTNEPYALAKIAGIKMCEAYNRQYGSNFLAVMPTNLYGPNDNFDLESSHVLPALLRKFHEAAIHKAPSVEVWGTGKPKREFLYVDDLADACVYLMKFFDQRDTAPFVNIGTGEDVEIRELASLIKRIVGYQGEIVFRSDKPDGTPRKWLDVSRMARLGWNASTTLEAGIQQTYDWYRKQHLIVRP